MKEQDSHRSEDFNFVDVSNQGCISKNFDLAEPSSRGCLDELSAFHNSVSQTEDI